MDEITLDVIFDVYEESGPQYDRIVYFCGESLVTIVTKPGVNVYPLIYERVSRQSCGNDFKITSIIWRTPTQ
jgi:hypothetical protein